MNAEHARQRAKEAVRQADRAEAHAPPAPMIRLAEERQTVPYVWVDPDEERRGRRSRREKRRRLRSFRMPLGLARARSRTSNVNRCISVRHDSGTHWARPSASASWNRKH